MRALFLAASTLSLALAAPALAEAPAPLPAAQDAAKLAPVPPGRLTDAAKPLAYRLDLTVDPSKARFSGHVEIDAELKRPSRFIDLHGRDLAMSEAAAMVGGKVYPARWFEIDPSGVARMVFDNELPAGPLKLVFKYDAPFNDGPAGMFRVKVGEDWYSWTQFQSIDARAAFPGFDEPGFKTPFTVTLRTPPGLVAVSNAPEVSKSLEGGYEVHRYAPTLPLPTYLMAMMVGPFATLEGTVPATAQRQPPLPIRIVTTKQNAPKMAFALEGTKGIVKHLEAYFNQGFPYPKLDQITTPILPGAMENAGADLYADPILIMDESAPTGQKRTFGMVVSHELAHQWFGDLVTPAWWDDLWLNESFANWMGYRIGHEWRPDLNIGAGALAEGFSAMHTDALVAGRAIRQPIESNAQIDEAFDTITYGKGGHVVAMIAGYMGDDRFRDGVRRYMAAHTYGSATSTDFFAAMAEAAGDPRIVPAMKSFTDQQGVPLVTFTRGKGGSWNAEQSRFTRFGVTAPETRWGIPLCLRPTKGKQQCQLLTDRAMTITSTGKGALMPNAGGTGYYRFELPTKDWDALIKLAGKLPGGEALALDDSLFASLLAGRSQPRQMIALARNLTTNPDSHAAETGFGSLDWFDRAGMFDAAGKDGYRRLIRTTFAPRLAKLGFDPRAGAYQGEDPERSQTREQVVARMVATAKDPVLREQLNKAAAAWIGGDKAALDPAWYELGFDVWLGQAGFDGAKRLVDLALASEDPLLRPAALRAVAGSGDPKLARWLLEEFKDERLRRRERLSLIQAVLVNRDTRDYGFTWLKTHFDELTAGGGGIFFTSRLPSLVGGFCSVERSGEIAALLRPKLTGKTGALDLERTIERVRSCGLLKEARAAEFSAAMAKLK
jgi:aminopeptidase N